MSAIPIFVDTNLDTHFAMDISPDDAVADLKRKVMVEHHLCFPDLGEITISAAKVRRSSCFYRLSDTMCIRSAFSGIKGTWRIHVDVDSKCLRKSQVASKETLLELENGRLEIPHPLELPSRNILADIAQSNPNDVLNHFPSEKQQHEIENSHTQNQKGPANSQFTSDPNSEASRSPGGQDPQPELGASTSNIGQKLDMEVLKQHDQNCEKRTLECHLSSYDNASGRAHGGSSEYLPSAFVSSNMRDGNKKRDLEIDNNLVESLQPAAVVQKRQKRERQKEDSLPPQKDIFDDATAIATAKEISEVENPNSEEISGKPLNNDFPSFQNHDERGKKKSSKQQDGVCSETKDKTGSCRMPLPPSGGPVGVIASEETATGGNFTSTDAAHVIHEATESYDHLKSGATQHAGKHTSKTHVAASELEKISMNVMERKLDASGNKVTLEEKKAKKPRRHNSSKCSSSVSAEDGNVTADTIPLEMLAEAVVRDANNVAALRHESLKIADENVNRQVAADAACSPMASSPNKVAASKVVSGMDVSIPPVASAGKKEKRKRRRSSSSKGVDPPSAEENGNIIKDATASTCVGNNDVNNHELDETRKDINTPTKTEELKVAGPDIDNSNYELGPQEAENYKDGIDSSKLTDGPKVTEIGQAKVRRGKKSNKSRGFSSRTHADDNTITASEKKISTENHIYATKEGTIALQAENVTDQQTEKSNSQIPYLEGGAVGEVSSVNTATTSGVQTMDFRVEKGRRKLKWPSSTDASELLTNHHDNKAVDQVTSIQERHDETGEVQNQSAEKEHKETGEIQNQDTGNMKQEKALPRKKKKAKSGKTDSKDPVSGSTTEVENNVGIDAVGPEKSMPNILEHVVDRKPQKSSHRGEIPGSDSSMNEARNDESVDLVTSIQEHDAMVEVLNPDMENMKQEKPSPRKKKKSKSGKTNSKDPVSGSLPEGASSLGIETVGSEKTLQKILEHDSGGEHQNSIGLAKISVVNSSVNEGKALDLASSLQERYDATDEALHENMENMKQEKASPRKKRKLKSGKTNSKDQGSGSITERENDAGIETIGSEKSLPKIPEHSVDGKHQKSNGTGEISVARSSMDEANDGNIDFKKFFVSEEKQDLAVDPAVNLAPGEPAKKSLKDRPDKVARKPDLHSEDSFHLRDPNSLDHPKREMKIHDGSVGNIEKELSLSRNDEDKNVAPSKRNKSLSEKFNNASGSSEHQYVSSPPNHNRYRNRYRVAVRKVPSKKFVGFNSSDLEKDVPVPESIFKHISSESSQDEGEVNDSDATTIDHSTDSSSASAHSDEEQDGTYSKTISLKNQSTTDSPIKGVSPVLGGKNQEDGFTDANLSKSKAARNSSIRRVLRGSSAYKKARVSLSQSRQDDFDSQPDMVPDSQGVGY